jgi:hypothetical protein
MRRVKCEECGKVYNFDVDDFCPRCGAFNQPPKASAINADGSVIRLDGINEKNHAGSFVHEELIDAVRQQMRPDGEDCEILSDRNDDKFSQKVRNLKSHGSIAELVRTTDARDCRWYLR